MTKKALLAAMATELPDGDVPTEIRLLPAGTFRTRPHDGRGPWSVKDADAIVSATKALKLDLPIDYDHQTQRSADNGKPAPAAGWIKDVFARDGEIWARVEWTKPGLKRLKRREYRYVSAVFFHDKAGVVTRIHGAALTNDPALYMEAIVSASTEMEDQLDPKELRKALGLPETATDAEVLAAASAALGAVKALKDMAKELGLPDGADAPTIATAVTAAGQAMGTVATAAGLAETASAEDVAKAVKTAIAGEQRSEADIEARAVAKVEARAELGALVKEKFLTPAQRKDFDALLAKEPVETAKAVSTLTELLTSGDAKFAGLSRSLVSEGRPDPDAELTPEELQVCAAMNISPDKYKETRKRMIDQGGDV